MSLTTCSRRTARTRLTLTSTMRSATGASCDWCDGLEMSTESYNDWMNDHDGGERFHAERKIDDFFSSGRFCEDAQPAQQVRAAASAPPPPPPPAGSPVATQEPEDWLALHPLANYSSQLGDWQPSGGDHNAWGSLPEPDDEEPVEQQAAQATDEPTNEPSALKPAHVPTPRAMFFHCGSFTTESRSQSHQPSHGRCRAPAPPSITRAASPPSNASTLIPRACLPARRRTIARSRPPRYAVLTAVWSRWPSIPKARSRTTMSHTRRGGPTTRCSVLPALAIAALSTVGIPRLGHLPCAPALACAGRVALCLGRCVSRRASAMVSRPWRWLRATGLASRSEQALRSAAR